MPKPLHPRRRLNAKRLACLLIPAALLAAGVHWLHASQVQGSARGLLWQAERAEARDDLPTAARYLSRYLVFVPEDDEALAKYALQLDRLARTNWERSQALLLLEQVLRRTPERRQVRRRLVRLAMSLGRFADARAHLLTLLRAEPRSGELEWLLGECEQANGRFAHAEEWYRKAMRHAPGRRDSYLRLAELLHARPELAARAGKRRPELAAVLAAAPQAGFPAGLPWTALILGDRRRWPHPAEVVINNLVAANPRSFQAHLARAGYRQQFHLAGAADDLARARRLAPRAAEVLLACAQWAQDNGRHDEARRHLQRGLKMYPENVALTQALARLEMHAGRPAAAAACLRQGFKAISSQPEAAWAAADLFIDAGAPADARRLMARLRRAGFPAERLDYLDARLEMHRGQWLRAATLFEQSRPLLARIPELTRQADLLLGRCYEQLGNPDLQLAAIRHALAVDPGWLPARRELAAALQALGRTDEAVVQYRQLSRLTPDGPVALVRLLIERNLRLPPARRRAPELWTEIDQVLGAAARARRVPLEVALWRAESLSARDRHDEAHLILQTARCEHPDRLEPWVALADLAQRRGDAVRAARLLEGARRQLGDSADLCLARVRSWARRPGRQSRAALRALEAESSKFAADRERLLRGLAAAYHRLGASGDTERVVRRLARREPNDLRWRLLLFDLSLEAGNAGTLKRLLAEVKRMEGDAGVFWRFGEAALLVWHARRHQQPVPAAARNYLAAVAARRGSWARVPLLEAEIEELAGNPERAIRLYQRAIDLGERRPRVARRLVQLLSERQRYEEANRVVRKILEETDSTRGLGRLAAELAVRAQDYRGAVALARQAVPADSPRADDHLWLGLIAWAAHQPRTAERELRRAIRLDGQAPAPRVALVQFLAGTGQRQRAEAALEEARRQLPAGQAVPALARGYEALGHPRRAEQEYRQALAARPEDVLVLRDAAAFFLRQNQPLQAEPLLRRLIGLSKTASENAAWARRQLALALARTGNERALTEALALLAQNARGGRPSAGDQRVKAVVLAAQPRRRREAIRLVEELVKRRTGRPEDQFLLARLYEATGQWPRARARMLALLAEVGEQPLYLAHYADSLLRRGQPEDAQPWVARLAELEPGAWRTILLRARVLHGQKQAAEAVALVEGHARQQPDDTGRAAALLDELGQPAAAERLYRRHAARSKDPAAVLALAVHLGRRGRPAEALRLCEQAWKTCPAEAVAGACVAVVRAGRPAADDVRRVEAWLRAASRQKPGSVPLTLGLANLNDLQGRRREAAALYRQVLQRDGRNTLALNNLAWVLAVQDGKGEEAARLIQRAIDLAGPGPELLDTRGVVHLSAGRARDAIRDFEEAVRSVPSAAGYFHLARAHRLARDPGAARSAWRRAKSLGLTEASLHPLERPAFRELVRELK
jgi:tetratricopeptide (TPR) repeat protein